MVSILTGLSLPKWPLSAASTTPRWMQRPQKSTYGAQGQVGINVGVVGERWCVRPQWRASDPRRVCLRRRECSRALPPLPSSHAHTQGLKSSRLLTMSKSVVGGGMVEGSKASYGAAALDWDGHMGMDGGDETNNARTHDQSRTTTRRLAGRNDKQSCALRVIIGTRHTKRDAKGGSKLRGRREVRRKVRGGS